MTLLLICTAAVDKDSKPALEAAANKIGISRYFINKWQLLKKNIR